MTLFRLLPAVAVTAALMLPSVAAAHARLVSSTPVAGSSSASPRVLSLTFSEKMAPAFSTFEVVNAAGVKIPVRTTVSEDGKTLSAPVARPLAAGAYVINWRLASSDGHRMTGAVPFTVR
ncbi:MULTISPECIES: copper homeostasis periplasmic binding protein CopC [unclassified Brevundimonas]|uniref:copper homeostasis periplasmic binding protein CopC n=1 Tax=unclassified Brevundimonas TaxID=2622653 RepID=UPI000CFB6E5E|nr:MULTISPECIES: copper homeostasis periplasmic binding protein CopC [unclassified Brevundimonas]PRA31944.1 copper resistance protein CopC [Brevundimonas sp. MYb27]PQZ82685.1 copper resistance protein CopC [Brevundimonas sp. MYb31]PRB17030.1 copper resistance protein CopC [Brevundimonas sp. MYb52]PRB37256.1 copper resistance protein CopC [Brevundimonas sp. MYb46]PRB48424.1 copper resistance protein CopC [Brevundimonas sp. MYb33]